MAASLQALRVYCARLRVSLNALRPTAPVHVSAILANLEICPWEPPQTFIRRYNRYGSCSAFAAGGKLARLGTRRSNAGAVSCAGFAPGEINLDQAREILAHFFIKGCEWITLQKTQSGDAQHYQNIVLAGTDEDGGEVANEVTRLILEVVEELPIGDFPIAVRMNRNSPGWLVDLTARVIAFGGGVVAVYNEEKVIQSLEKFGYPARVARRFANDGCWEVQIPGETSFMYYPFDGYYLLQRKCWGWMGGRFPNMPALRKFTMLGSTLWNGSYARCRKPSWIGGLKTAAPAAWWICLKKIALAAAAVISAAGPVTACTRRIWADLRYRQFPVRDFQMGICGKNASAFRN